MIDRDKIYREKTETEIIDRDIQIAIINIDMDIGIS